MVVPLITPGTSKSRDTTELNAKKQSYPFQKVSTISTTPIGEGRVEASSGMVEHSQGAAPKFSALSPIFRRSSLIVGWPKT